LRPIPGTGGSFTSRRIETLVAAVLVIETLFGEPLGESLERDEPVALGVPARTAVLRTKVCCERRGVLGREISECRSLDVVLRP
jgi:hypothetical protein